MTVDTRFYASNGALSLGAVAELVGAEVTGDASRTISGVAAADQAGPDDIAFVEATSKQLPAIAPAVGALIISEQSRRFVPDGVPFLVHRQPRFAHGLVANRLFTARHLAGPRAGDTPPVVHPSCSIAPGAVISPGACIGEHTRILPNAVIGPGVQIGRHCIIGANASVFCALIGDYVRLLSGARIGEAGFGVSQGPTGAEDVPHFGRVIIQDHVTVGANSCIDRGVFADTIIGERTKIDNLCQIAHNVILGRSVIVAAFGGISGSVRVGDGSMLGGRVGIADHVTVGERVSLAASAGLFRDVDSGETWGGTPAKPIRQWMREVAWLQKQASGKKPD